MKILTVLGSPRKNGNTSKVLDVLDKKLSIKGHETERVQITDYIINGCVMCNACHSPKTTANCVQKDDFMTIYHRMASADVVVYASPLYAWSFTAQMKPFIDRHYCLVTNPGLPEQSSVLEGKRVALIVTCSEPMENNADLIQIAFDRSFLRLKCLVVGKYIVDLSYSPDFELRARTIAERIANEITS